MIETKGNIKKIAVIGGGTGSYTVLRGLKNYPVHLSAIVSMADDGGSTGKLRDEYGVLPPGDIRRCLVALSDSSDLMKKLFEYRFSHGSLEGHSFGNLFLTALKEITREDGLSIKEAGKILKIRGKVLPVTLGNIKLCAELEDGQLIIGETKIDVPRHNSKLKIKKIFLYPEVDSTKEVLDVISDADLIIIGPGDLYTSIIPNFLVRGVSEAVANSKARKVYICNLMTKNGETNNFKVTDFVTELEKYLGKEVIDTVIYNQGNYDEELLNSYELEKAYPVGMDKENFSKFDMNFISGDLTSAPVLIRHDSEKLAKFLLDGKLL